MTSTARPGNADDSQWFTLRNFSIFLGALLAIWFWPVIIGGATFIFRDFGYFGYPLAFHHREAFWRGEVPLWNPLNHCGIPFLAQWNTMTLYPGSLLYLLLPLEFSLSWFDLLHLWLAGVGMFLLARSWYGNGFAAALAGTGFAISGLSLNFLLWPNNVAAMSWMPFVIWLGLDARGEKKHFLSAIAVGAMQMLTGAPEVILLTWGILFTLVAVECIKERKIRPIKMFMATAVLVALICAVQLLPFLDLTHISQRTRDFGGAFWAMPLWGWASFFVPLVFTYPLASEVRFQYDQLWTSSYYPSIILTLVAIVGAVFMRRRTHREKALYALAFGSLLLAFGPAGFFYSFCKAVVPGLGLIRFPIKFVIVILFALPLLAAGVAIEERPSMKVRKNIWRALGVVVIATLAYARFYPKFAPPYDNWRLSLQSGCFTFFFATIAVVCLAGVRHRFYQIALIALIPLDIGLHAPNPAPTINRSALVVRREPMAGRVMLSRQTFAELYDHPVADDTHSNFLSNRVVLNADLNLIDDIAKVDGFYSLNTEWAERLRNQVYAKGQGNLEAIMDFMGVTRVTSTNNIFEWLSRTNAMPLVSAGQSPRTLEETNCLYALFDRRFIPRDKVVFSASFSGYETNRVDADVRNAKRTDQTISFDVTAAKPTFALVAESFHPNWQVTVNGQPGHAIRANYAFMAIPVLKGTSHVEMKYEDGAFKAGLIISLLTVFGLIAYSFRNAA